MSKVTMVVVTSEAALPAGETFGQYKFSILASDGTTGVQSMESPNTSVIFPSDVLPGSYVASVQALSGTGKELGGPATAAFTVAPTPTYGQPASVTVTVS